MTLLGPESHPKKSRWCDFHRTDLHDVFVEVNIAWATRPLWWGGRPLYAMSFMRWLEELVQRDALPRLEPLRRHKRR